MRTIKLKSIVVCATIVVSIMACNTTEKENGQLDPEMVKNGALASSENKEDAPVITFEKETHDFGKIKEGEKIAYAFKFTNSGKSDLIITDAKGSCGCTVPNYPTQPIAPGDGGIINVSFDSAGKSGKQNKTVTLLTNGIPATKVLTIIGEVEHLNTK